MAQEASFTFTTPLNVNLIEIKGVEHLYVEGDISTNDIDLVNDVMTKKCQESMQKQILERNMKLDLEHEAFKGSTHEEKEINKTKIPAGKLIDAVVKDLGENRYSTRVKGEINPHHPNYKSIKGNLLDGYLDAFSVAFLPVSVTKEERDGVTVQLLNDVLLLNVALTGNPCNTKAQLTEIFTKSMDALEDYKKLKELDPSVEKHLVVKSHLTGLVGNKKVNKQKNSKMTENNPDSNNDPDADNGENQETDNGEGNDSGNAETQKMFKSMSEVMKTLSEKYEEVSKENVDMKEDMKEISKNLAIITEALGKPIHKSQGIQKTDAENKAKADEETKKSVDPLSLF